MNSYQPMLPQVPPAIPLQSGRPEHNVPYTPSPHPPQQIPYYQSYQYQYSPQFARPPQQWTPYPVQIPMGRIYHPYPPMTPYHVPQHPPPVRPSPTQAPSSSSLRSVQGLLSPSSSNTSLHIPLSTPTGVINPHLSPPTPPLPPISPAHRTPFYPPLPWQSFEGTFPPRAPRRRRRTPVPQSSTAPVELPSRQDSTADTDDAATIYRTSYSSTTEPPPPTKETLSEPTNLLTPSTSHPPSEDMSTQPTTPSSAAPPQQVTPKVNSSGRPNVPILPIVPAIPNIPLVSRISKRTSVSGASDAANGAAPLDSGHSSNAVGTIAHAGGNDVSNTTEGGKSEKVPSIKVPPKSWADLVRTMGPPHKPGAPQVAQVASDSTVQVSNGIAAAKAGSLADALSSYSVKQSDGSTRIAFLEPRGLVNTGNMCYMNSILQVLVFCVPFYNCLEKIGKQAAHSFKSDTPLIDAMIMFMREFKIIDAAVSIEQLRMRLKDNELEQYGEPFTPDFVYEVIQRLPRFASMRRGHQQDAEEFLGFLLEEMHDECSRIMRSMNNETSSGASTPTNGVISPISESTYSPIADEGGWLEVGPKQRAAITRSSGAIVTESPVTKIFGGKLRSELRVPGMKNSVTLEPYQALQLDIGAPHLSNIIDALKVLTKPETLHGAFNSPRGPGSTATKQVSIETLPQVLILHLKRFQYDSSGGIQKIWRKVGYPLDLEIPKEVFPQYQRGRLLAHGGLPKYRLNSVLYHHGKNAGMGHYTADVLRQDEREWIQLDDTIIRRIRSRDVAEGGSENDPKTLAAALEQHKNDQHYGSNFYEQFAAENEDQKQADKGWNEVNGGLTTGHSTTSKKWSGVINGNTTPSGRRTPVGRASVKDNKVAYMLFYERVNT